MSSVNRLALLNGLGKSIFRPLNGAYPRWISTSGKNRDTSAASVAAGPAAASEAASGAASPPKKNWISYGFSIEDQKEDRTYLHGSMFLGVTLTFVIGGFLLAYRPDDLGRDWAQREGFLELRRREHLGLPLVDPNYIPENKIKLPSDEELGDAEIII